MAGNSGSTALLTDSILNQPFEILGDQKSVPDPVIPDPVIPLSVICCYPHFLFCENEKTSARGERFKKRRNGMYHYTITLQ